jgi:hypothetical protein
MPRPAFLKQFGEFTAEDFVQHPVWISVHGLDEEEPWYDEDDCNEETFRPWTAALPVSPEEGLLLVAAIFTLADGASLAGFITPQRDGESLNLGIVQPHVFFKNQVHDFWDGMFRRKEEYLRTFYLGLNKTAREIFPIAFSAKPGLASGQLKGRIEGFYFTEAGRVRVYQ